MKRVIRDINEAMGGVSTSSRMGIGAGATGDLKNSLVQYRQLLSNLDKVRKVSEGLLLKIADIAQKVNAKPYIYIFYQTELRPVPVRLVMDALMQNNDLKFDAQELFLSDKAEKPFEVEKIKQALLDAKAVCNFGYIKSKSIRSQQYDMKDHSQDLYGIFSEMAKATSGLVETTVKPKAVFKKAFEGK
jgi:DNA-dependent RNA polymerase auxiliary subunit epsilon